MDEDGDAIDILVQSRRNRRAATRLTPVGSQVAIAPGDTHRVMSPRPTSARSYEAQFATRYFVVYVG